MPSLRLAARSLGFLLLGALVLSVGPARLGAALGAADGGWLALAAPGFLLFTLVKALRWFALLRLGGTRYPLGRALAVYQASAFLAFVTPGRVGDFAKAAYLRRDLGTPWAAGVASTLADRALDLAVLAVAAAAALAVAAPPGPLRSALLGGLALAAVAAPVLVAPRFQRVVARLLARLPVRRSAHERGPAAPGRAARRRARARSGRRGSCRSPSRPRSASAASSAAPSPSRARSGSRSASRRRPTPSRPRPSWRSSR